MSATSSGSQAKITLRPDGDPDRLPGRFLIYSSASHVYLISGKPISFILASVHCIQRNRELTPASSFCGIAANQILFERLFPVVRQSTFDCILPVWCTNVDCSDLETEFHSLLTKTFHQLAIDIDRATRIPSYFILPAVPGIPK
jgi:hypothetical protein